ncbi:odorant receptor 30a-like [Stomoxys calcitrans]|uniref:odorant receptor 30a-like n=1 Tax=Stomoxys calcitrans TaxID=35570 RepID=UPI0027E2DE98|nr:odorant receptor 30a-like [Stomoxys calcitrans]
MALQACFIAATIEDVPLYNNSLRIMKFWSLLLRHNWRRYANLIPYILITMSQFVDIYFSKEPMDAMIRNAYLAVLFFNTTFRAVVLCANRFEFEEFLERVRLLYNDLMKFEDIWVRKKLQEITLAANSISKVNLVMGTCSVISFLMYPLFATTKVLPFGIYVPGVNKYESPFYEIFFLVQIILAPIGCCMFIPFTNLMVALLLFAILMCQVLQRKLRHLKDLNSQEARETIVWCIKYQCQLMRYVNTINDLTSYTFLVEFLAFGAMLCAMMFTLVTVETISQMLLICIYILMIFAQSSILYYYANELYDESMNVANAAFESDWFNFDISNQKMLKLLILKAQQPSAIMVGHIYPMNLKLLQSLLNTTYTYFNLLRNVYN